MHIINLVDKYINFVCAHGDFESYEETCPELFAHYYQFWSKRNSDKLFDKTKILTSQELILSLLPEIENKFNKNQICIKDLTIILFVGMGNTNGHAFKYKNKIVVWIPVETYTNEIDIKVFITHEVAHALQYTANSNFYFKDKIEQKHLGRQLITEGVATYFSKNILNISEEVALWGDYLVKADVDTWIYSCKAQLHKLKQIAHSNFNSSENSLGLFYANDPNDIFNFRSGYFIGLKLVEQFVKSEHLNLKELIQIPRKSFEQKVISLLES